MCKIVLLLKVIITFKDKNVKNDAQMNTLFQRLEIYVIIHVFIKHIDKIKSMLKYVKLNAIKDHI